MRRSPEGLCAPQICGPRGRSHREQAPAALTEEQRADILKSLEVGCVLAIACGTVARLKAAQALAAADPAWAKAMREATLAGQPAPVAPPAEPPSVLTATEQAYILDSVALGGPAAMASRAQGIPGARWAAALKEPTWAATLAAAEEQARAGLRAVLPRAAAKEAGDGRLVDQGIRVRDGGDGAAGGERDRKRAPQDAKGPGHVGGVSEVSGGARSGVFEYESVAFTPAKLKEAGDGDGVVGAGDIGGGGTAAVVDGRIAGPVSVVLDGGHSRGPLVAPWQTPTASLPQSSPPAASSHIGFDGHSHPGALRACPRCDKGRADMLAEEAERPAPGHSRRASEATDTGEPDWARITRQAAALAPGPFGFVLWQEERLAASNAGFPALSPYSLWLIEAFFASLKRWMLVMAGRGFGKSTFVSRLASALGQHTARRPAPGPCWIWPFVSVLPVDAERRLEDIKAILLHAYLQELKITSPKSTPTMVAKDAAGNAIAWVSSASTIGNVSGPSSFGATVDEEEKILFGRAGEIIGSLAMTFRSRPNVRGFRVSSAMTSDSTLAGDCKKGQTITNFVATLGPFVDEAIAGMLAVAGWEEHGDATNRRAPNPGAAAVIRAHALSLTDDSWQIPTWLGHPSIGCPDDNHAAWLPGDAAIATRIEAEAVPEKARDGLPPWRYWLRECGSLPTGDEAAWETEGAYEVVGDLGRYAEEMTGEREYR